MRSPACPGRQCRPPIPQVLARASTSFSQPASWPQIVKQARSRAVGTPLSALELLQHAVADHKEGLKEEDVDVLLQQLWEHKQALQQQQREASMELLLHFLHSSR